MRWIFVLTLLFSLLLVGCSSQSVEMRDNCLGTLVYNLPNGDIHGFSSAAKSGVGGVRLHPGITWEHLQPDLVSMDYSLTDKFVSSAIDKGFSRVLITIYPYHSLDQSSCRSSEELLGCQVDGSDWFYGELGEYRCAPCALDSWSNVVTDLVERYDGDGIDDYSELVDRFTVEYEIMNEPELQDMDLVFFRGSALEYVEIYNVTSSAILSADSSARVLAAGYASAYDRSKEFWSEAMSLGLEFDTGSVHCIGNCERDVISEFSSLTGVSSVDFTEFEPSEDENSYELTMELIPRVENFYFVQLEDDFWQDGEKVESLVEKCR